MSRVHLRTAVAVLLTVAAIVLPACTNDEDFWPTAPTGRTEIYGDLTISTQQGVDNLAGIKKIVGDLTINGGEITHLTGLSDLRSVSGRLRLSRLIAIADLEILRDLVDVGALDIYNSDLLSNLDPLADVAGAEDVRIHYCDHLTSLPDGQLLRSAKTVTLLDLPWLGSLMALASADSVSRLELQRLSEGLDYGVLSGLTTLADLELEDLDITVLPNLTGLPLLTDIKLDRLESLDSFVGISNLGALTDLELWKCPLPISLEGIRDCPELVDIDIQNCEGLTGVGNMSGLGTCRRMNFWRCADLVDLTGLPPSLVDLRLSSCTSLADLGGLAGLPSLRTLSLSELPDLMDLTVGPDELILSGIYISNCPNLASLAGLRLETDGRLDLNQTSKFVDLTEVAFPFALGYLHLYDSHLTSLAGLEDLVALGSLSLNSNALTSLTGLDGVRTIRSSISITDNADLLDASALAGIDTAGDWGVTIARNAQLDSCVVRDMVTEWVVGGDIELEDNGPCAE